MKQSLRQSARSTLVWIVALEQDRAQRWAQGYRNKAGDNGGGRDRNCKLFEE